MNLNLDLFVYVDEYDVLVVVVVHNKQTNQQTNKKVNSLEAIKCGNLSFWAEFTCRLTLTKEKKNDFHKKIAIVNSNDDNDTKRLNEMTKMNNKILNNYSIVVVVVVLFDDN